MNKTNGNASRDINYRAHFAARGLSRASLDAACAMALERLNRLLGQRVRRELERMRRTNGHE